MQLFKSKKLTDAESREIVTPYAFGVSPDLLGVPLASPSRRIFALLVDVIAIAILSEISGVFLTFFIAILFFRAGRKLKGENRGWLRRKLMYGTSAVLVVLAVLVYSENMDTNLFGRDDSFLDDTMTAAKLLKTSVAYGPALGGAKQMLEQGNCATEFECIQAHLTPVLVTFAHDGIKKDVVEEAVDDIMDELAIEERSNTKTKLMKIYNGALPLEQQKDIGQPSQEEPEADKEDKAYSASDFFSWLKDFIQDNAADLGWAAFYFTAFNAYFAGQTVGKKLMKIKVVRIDGHELTLWEAFGRYGGYAAGLATGLGGFFQIYWDPNRQAIHDKISETVVIDLNKPRVDLELQQSEAKDGSSD